MSGDCFASDDYLGFGWELCVVWVLRRVTAFVDLVFCGLVLEV